MDYPHFFYNFILLKLSLCMLPTVDFCLLSRMQATWNSDLICGRRDATRSCKMLWKCWRTFASMFALKRVGWFSP
jgi:hypothetical protein